MGWLTWIALVPLLIACNGMTSLQAATLGFVSGMSTNIMTYHWLFEVKGFGIHHFAVLSTFFALYPAAWCAAISWLNRHQRSLIFTAPALWILLDYVRAHAGFMAFPWGTLAQTQHQNLAILQIATVTGEYGVTFLIVLGNVAVASIILKREWKSATVVALVIGLVHLGGAIALSTDRSGPTIRLAAVQPNILLDERATRPGRAAVFNRLDRLTREAAGSHPALIAWPETAIAGNLRADLFLAADLLALAQEVGAPIIFGAGEVEKFAGRDAHGNLQRRAYNSAYVVTPQEGLSAPYIKRVLMPFGEYLPLEKIIGWPAWLAPPTFQKVPGDRPAVYTAPQGFVFSPLICWENLFPELARESVRNGAQVLVVLTNDGWFGRTAEPIQHNLASVLRAIENRVPIVVSSNSGPSHIIDAYGRVIIQAPGIFREEVVTGGVQLGPSGTLYTHMGDILVFIATGGLVVVALRCFFNQHCFAGQ
ncbi:MAG TPA: apolipoprotein N-acyltransferase [Nitrospira sp.]|nr:apolipoprotein N-acyltransferase [Nitrospira sp.]